MSFIPYSCQTIEPADIEAVSKVLRSEYLTQGPTVKAFEDAFAKMHQVPFAVSVSNATAGLHIACLALGAGPGSLVWTSPNSFIASANCALYCGAQIDFVDIDPVTRNMSVKALRDKLTIAQVSGRLPSIVIPVDFSGLSCDMQEIKALADQFGFKVLEDASHATGATYRGASVGSRYSDVTVFSFHAVKIVTTAEGGMVTTRDPKLAKRIGLLRSHGMTRESADLEQTSDGAWYYEQQELGFNYRLTDVQAAIGLSQLNRVDQMREQREAIARRYDQLLADLPLILPPRPEGRQSSWHLYAVEIDDRLTEIGRAEVFKSLREAQIGVNVHYIPIHTQPYYRRLGFAVGDFPNSERYYRRAISIPLFPRLTQSDQDRVVEQISIALQH